MSDVCAVILAAGEGTRLRPLTASVPKALCPVGNVPLLDLALARVGALGLDAAVNACYLADQVVAHVVAAVGDTSAGSAGRPFVGVEPGDPWGTAGGLARLREWIDGRGVLVGNADAYLSGGDLAPGPDIAAMLDGWDGDSVRLLGVPNPGGSGGFSGYRFAGFSLLPWSVVRDLPVERGELVRVAWRPAERAGRLSVVEYPGLYLDTGTPETYLAANLHAAAVASSVAGGSLIDPTATVTAADVSEAVIGAGAVVAGSVRRAVVWPGAEVAAGESLENAIRAYGGLTIAVG